MTNITAEDHDNLRAIVLDQVVERVEDLIGGDFADEVADIAGIEYTSDVEKEVWKILRELANEIEALNF